jgi:hypothetical protein
MNCEQAQALFVAYLDHETTPSEQALLRAHLAGCEACQKELSKLSTTREQISSALQRRAAQAAPPPEAWDRLEAQLTEAAQPSPAQSGAWLRRRAPEPSHRPSPPTLVRGITMRKPLVLAAGLAAVTLIIGALWLFNGVAPVSARTILDRAYQAQSQAAVPQGIEHTRTETYSNYQALPEDQGLTLIVESYHDFQSGNFRVVTTVKQTGQVQNVFGYDGINTYSRAGAEGGEVTSGPLVVYRSPQSHVSQSDIKPPMGNTADDVKAMFDQIRNDPHAQLVGQEAWADGRKVYVVRSQQAMKVIVNGALERPAGTITNYFEVDTYKLVGYRMTMFQDGKELLIGAFRLLADEILPAGSLVAWDLSDLQGITLVDDPDRTRGDLLPEVISPQDLAAKTPAGYLLQAVPDGFALEISAPPKQATGDGFIYIASYRNSVDDYFVIQSIGPVEAKSMFTGTDPAYTTASGLVVHFQRDTTMPSGRQFTSAVVEAPSGVVFMLNSTLPADTVKAWAEKLALVH